MSEDAVEPQEEVVEQMDQIIDDAQEASNDDVEQVAEQTQDKKMVPLSALQKLRDKKRELELELQWERQRNAQQALPQKPVEEDNSRYESATKEDLRSAQEEAIRSIEEKLWIRQNPEKYEIINEHLPQFLKQRPNLASAISQSSNRYEEAYTLMNALTPKQQAQIKKDVSPKKQAPNAPGGVPKAAALNGAVDVMGMSDSEFAAWRQSKKRVR